MEGSHISDMTLVVAEVEGGVDSELVSMIRELTENERAVLYAEIEYVRDVKLSEKGRESAIMRRAGVNKMALWRIRQRSRYQEALSLALMSSLRSELSLAIRALRQKVQDGHMGAIKLWLELSKVWHPVSRVMSLNVTSDARDLRGKSAEEMRRMVVKDWKSQGWGKEEFEQLWEGGEEGVSKDSER